MLRAILVNIEPKFSSNHYLLTHRREGFADEFSTILSRQLEARGAR